MTSSNRRPSGAARRRSQPALSHASHATPDQRDDQRTHLRATCACSYRKTAWALGRIRSDKHCGRHAIPSPWQEQGSALPAVSRRSEELEVRLPTAAPEMRLLLSNTFILLTHVAFLLESRVRPCRIVASARCTVASNTVSKSGRSAGCEKALLYLQQDGLLRDRPTLLCNSDSEAFRHDPSKVWQFYHYRRSVVMSAAPNAAHLSLAQLLLSSSDDSLRKRIMPNAQSFHLITQNVDGLSGRALQEVRSAHDTASIAHATSSIIEMHGNLFKTICTSCGDARIDTRQPLSEGLRGTEDILGEYRSIPIGQLPRCEKSGCGGLLRPGVVWFGESIPELDRIQPLVRRCDLILVLGTSSTVYRQPASRTSSSTLTTARWPCSTLTTLRAARTVTSTATLPGPSNRAFPRCLRWKLKSTLSTCTRLTRTRHQASTHSHLSLNRTE